MTLGCIRVLLTFDALSYVLTNRSSSSKSLNSILSYFTWNRLSARARSRRSFGCCFISLVITNLPGVGVFVFFFFVDEILEAVFLAELYWIYVLLFLCGDESPSMSFTSNLWSLKELFCLRFLYLYCTKLLATSTSFKLSLIFLIEVLNYCVLSLYSKSIDPSCSKSRLLFLTRFIIMSTISPCDIRCFWISVTSCMFLRAPRDLHLRAAKIGVLSSLSSMRVYSLRREFSF